MLMPLGMTILTRAAGPHRVGRVMAVLGIPMLLGPIFGPILGGWLIDVASWHWIFLINLPIGIAALIYAALALPKDDPHPSESFDWIGMALLSPGLAAFLYGVSSIPSAGTVNDRQVLLPGIIGLLLIVAFVGRAVFDEIEHPLVDLHLLQNRQMSVAVIGDVAVRDGVLRRQHPVRPVLHRRPRRGHAQHRAGSSPRRASAPW